jgi:hypothetical protein
MWWTYQAGSTFTARYPNLGRHTFYRGLGTGEQGLWVIPDADLVVVHRADTDHARRIEGEDHWKLVESVLAARRHEPAPRPALRALQPTALRSQLPAATIPAYRTLAGSALRQYLGDYELAPGAGEIAGRKLTPRGTVRVFLFDEKPFMHLPGVGDVQILPIDRDTFTARAVLGLSIAFERDPNGKVKTLTVTVGGRTFTASRTQSGPSRR